MSRLQKMLGANMKDPVLTMYCFCGSSVRDAVLKSISSMFLFRTKYAGKELEMRKGMFNLFPQCVGGTKIGESICEAFVNPIKCKAKKQGNSC